MSLDDFHFDERDKKLLEAVLAGVKGMLKPIKTAIEKVEKRIDPLEKKFDKMAKALEKKGLLKPFAFSSSPKKVTERGHELFKKVGVADYLKENCDLLKKSEELKKETDAQIFIKCLDWAKTTGREKAVEIHLNTNLSQNECYELLALAILETIKK